MLDPDLIAVQQLPPGPWLHGLRHLEVTAEVAEATTLPVLAAARQLEDLELWGGSNEQLAALFRWVVAHGTSLRRLVVDRMKLGPEAWEAWEALADLKVQRPFLQVVLMRALLL